MQFWAPLNPPEVWMDIILCEYRNSTREPSIVFLNFKIKYYLCFSDYQDIQNVYFSYRSLFENLKENKNKKDTDTLY